MSLLSSFVPGGAPAAACIAAANLWRQVILGPLYSSANHGKCLLNKDVVAQGITSLFVAGTYVGITLIFGPLTRFNIAIASLIGGVSFFSGLLYRKRDRDKSLTDGDQHLSQR